MAVQRKSTLRRRSTSPDGDGGGRERVLRAAVRLFAAKGYAATTVRDILREARVTAPVLYHHFGSKEGVFRALVNEGARQMGEAQARALALEGTATQRLRAWCRATAALRRDHADLSRIVDAVTSGPPGAAPPFDFRSLVTAWVRQVVGLLREGIERGELEADDPQVAALALLAATDFATRPGLAASVVAESGATLDDLLDLLLARLARRRR